jgi:uncharacterized metal-binding protein YceD (DUF177 family)
MLINFEELRLEKYLSLKEDIDFSSREVDDALLKKVNRASVTVNVTLIENNEALINIDCVSNVEYLDARTLEQLNVNFMFQEEVLFTDDLQKAQELDIDFTEGEINLEDLIWELVLVSIPYNYSESEKIVTHTEEKKSNEQAPFANLFKK